MNIEKMKAFAQAQRESEESTEIRPAPKSAEPEYQPEAIYIPIEDDEPSEIPDDIVNIPLHIYLKKFEMFCIGINPHGA